jgi:hypothetical protein
MANAMLFCTTQQSRSAFPPRHHLQSANKLKELGVYVKEFDEMVAEAAAGGMPIHANLLKHVDWQIENLQTKCRPTEKV